MVSLVWLVIIGILILLGKTLLGIDVLSYQGLGLVAVSALLSAIITAVIVFIKTELRKCPKCNSHRIVFDEKKHYYTCKRCKSEFYADGRIHRIDMYV